MSSVSADTSSAHTPCRIAPIRITAAVIGLDDLSLCSVEHRNPLFLGIYC